MSDLPWGNACRDSDKSDATTKSCTIEQRSGHLSVNGLQLEYATWGNPPQNSVALVLLHEGLGCVALWRDFPSRLCAETGCSVLAYSRAGYGQSDPCELPRPLDYMTREAIDVLPQVLDAAGIKRCVLLGHSDGATIAAIYTGSTEDHRVRALVLIAPHFFTEPLALDEIARARQAYEITDMSSRMAKYHRNPAVAFRGWNDAWLDPGFNAWNVADVIDYIRVPVLAMQGKKDQYGSYAQIDVLEQRLYAPLQVHMLDDCQHSPHQEKQQACCDSIGEFVERLVRIDN